MYADVLTKERALKIARSWCTDRAKQPDSYRGWNQYRWLMEEMAVLCAAESLKNSEDEDQLYERLGKLENILWNVRYAGAPEIANRFWSEGEKPTENEQKIINKAKATIWRRRDPKRSFQEGFESEHYTAFDQNEFHSTVANYLKEPWLRHPVLDWILVDMMVSRELSTFGEHLKHQSLYDARYFETKGNLLKIRTVHWKAVGTKLLRWFALPIGAIYIAYQLGYEVAGNVLTGLYIAAIVFALAFKIFRLLVRIGYAVAGKTDPRAKPFVLWEEMYGVWKLLEGPTVNPTLVREMMVKTRDRGAVWDVPVWSIIDRVIQHDSAVWIVRADSSS